MQVHNFRRNVIRFISIYLNLFDNNIHRFIMNKKVSLKSEKWKIAMSLMLKHIISGYQHHFPKEPLANKLITDTQTKIRPINLSLYLCLDLEIRNIINFDNKLLDQRALIFPGKHRCYQKCIISVKHLCLMISDVYEYMKIMMYKVTGSMV